MERPWIVCLVHIRSTEIPLTKNFIESFFLGRKPIVDVSEALNMTMAGVIAHKSALKDGQWMKVPQYDL